MTGGAIALGVAVLVIAALLEFSILATRRIERAIPPQGRFLDLDGERLHYVDAGAGPSLVLIHGLAGQLGNFTHSLLVPLSGDFRVVAFDRPGSGYSTRAAGSPAGLRAQAATLARAIRALELDRPVVVGHSLGGAVALAIALDHPESVSGLALIAPLTHPVMRPPLLFLGLALPSGPARKFLAWTLATPVSLLARDWGARQVFSPETPPKDFAVAGGALLGVRPRNVWESGADMLAANGDLSAMAPRYPSLAIPVGVLYGHGDAILDWRAHGETLAAEIPGLDLEVVAGGHMLPVTAPDAVAAFIRRIAAKSPRAQIAPTSG